jgi:cytochrome c oxidase assembly protein subunit 15
MISLSTKAAARDPWVGAWLIAIALCVFAMVMVGGATRLTDSGLSITEWNIEKEFVPPLSHARWMEEFSLYQRTTEYQMQNRGMSLGEFQRIFWWEWAHRFVGKMIGFVFAIPFVFFWATGRLRGRFWPVLGLFALGGLQGAIGWWMVVSGLFGRLDVSPVRLAVHLGMAFAILAWALWLALDAFGWPQKQSKLGAPRWAALALMALVFAQVMFGALLAGARGGAAYPDWPTIGHQWIPASAFSLEPFWRNFTDDHATQQLMHRTTGYLVGLVALVVAGLAMRRGNGAARGAALGLGAAALGQAALGVATVLSAIPLALALAHQAGAAALWALAVVLTRSVYGSIKPPSQHIERTQKKVIA